MRGGLVWRAPVYVNCAIWKDTVRLDNTHSQSPHRLLFTDELACAVQMSSTADGLLPYRLSSVDATCSTAPRVNSRSSYVRPLRQWQPWDRRARPDFTACAAPMSAASSRQREATVRDSRRASRLLYALSGGLRRSCKVTTRHSRQHYQQVAGCRCCYMLPSSWGMPGSP